ncbi:MAG: hypothetical protein FJ387_16745 [Verrucomicrobia bacterium]|nr:hypothetical protein [Verrucomicrobiota bacterium]
MARATDSDSTTAIMKRLQTCFRAQALALAASAAAYAQTAPSTAATATLAPPAPTPPTPPSAGFVNDWLRAQDEFFGAWDLGGQFRLRFEHRENLAIAGVPGAIDFRAAGADHGNSYWLYRTKAHLGYAPTSWAKAFVEGRDSGVINDERLPSPEADRTELHQAYLSLGHGAAGPWTLKLGRQELAYGDERLIGAFEWNNVGRVFDAVKLRFERPAIWVDGFVGRVVVPDNHNFNTPNDYEYFYGLYASSRTVIPTQETQLYFLGRNAGLQSPSAQTGALAGLASPRDVYTVGARVKSLPGRLGSWDYAAEVAGQFGRFKDSAASPSLDHEAFAIHLGGGHTFKDGPWSPRLGLEYNFATGDSDPADGQHGTFDNLFPTNHKFYGYMDLFAWQNLHNPRLSLSVKPTPRLTVTLDYHLFWLADTHDSFYTAAGGRRGGLAPTAGAGYGINPEYSRFVGSELDLVASYTLKPWASGQIGFGHFFVGDYAKNSLAAPGFGATDANWVYVQGVLSF